MRERCPWLAEEWPDGREEPEAPKPLTGRARDAANHITQHPGETGDTIARAIKVQPPSFRRIFCDKLRPRGYYNVGSGYFPPGV